MFHRKGNSTENTRQVPSKERLPTIKIREDLGPLLGSKWVGEKKGD